MADQEEKTFRLEGFEDLLGFKESRENDSAGRMAAGANVEALDGEWWVRPGYRPRDTLDGEDATPNLASMPWWTISDKGSQKNSSTFVHIFNPFYCLQFRFTSQYGVRAAYLPASSGITVTFTNGSTAAIRVDAASITVGQLLMVNGDHETTSTEGVYRVIAYADPIIVLDRVYAGDSGNKNNCAFINPIADPTNYFVTLNPLKNLDGLLRDEFGWAVIDQNVTRGGSTLGYTNSATVAEDQYLIITSPVAEPVAINMSDSSKGIDTDFFRDTADAAPNKILRGWTCCTWNDQLVVAHAGDNLGAFTERGVWLSLPLDYQIFHANTQGENGDSRSVTMKDHQDPIIAVLPLGANLIVHRNRSQNVGSAGPDATVPATFTRNNQGFGAVSSRSIVAVNGVHYLWTQVGPCVFDGASITPLALKYREFLKGIGLWDSIPIGVYEDRQRARVVWMFNGRASKYLTDTDADDSNVTVMWNNSGATDVSLKNRGTNVVFDYTRNRLWLEDVPLQTGAGIRDDLTMISGVHGMVYDTSLQYLPGKTSLGKDIDHVGTETVVPAFVETPWFNLGNLRAKQLNSLYLELRALATTKGTKPWATEDLWSLTTETLRYCTVEVLADHEPDVKQTLTGAQLTVSTMLALEPEADLNHPTMLIQLSPRVHGSEFKLRFHNLENTAVTQGTFRLRAVEGTFIQEQSTRVRRPLNKT